MRSWVVSLYIVSAVWSAATWWRTASAEAQRDTGYVIEKQIVTPYGRERCYIWMGPAMSFKIRLFLLLGCYEVPRMEKRDDVVEPEVGWS